MTIPKVDVSEYRSDYSLMNKLARTAWVLVSLLCFRFTPTRCFAWRRIVLRLFGAKIGRKVDVYQSARIWAPWNLEMGDYSSLSRDVDCYSVDKVTIGAHATVSQYCHICTAGHDTADPKMKLVRSPITIEDGAWVCAGAYLGSGVRVREGAVVAARAVVVKDVDSFTIVGGNPAVFIKKRELRSV